MQESSALLPPTSDHADETNNHTSAQQRRFAGRKKKNKPSTLKEKVVDAVSLLKVQIAKSNLIVSSNHTPHHSPSAPPLSHEPPDPQEVKNEVHPAYNNNNTHHIVSSPPSPKRRRLTSPPPPPPLQTNTNNETESFTTRHKPTPNIFSTSSSPYLLNSHPPPITRFQKPIQSVPTNNFINKPTPPPVKFLPKVKSQPLNSVAPPSTSRSIKIDWGSDESEDEAEVGSEKAEEGPHLEADKFEIERRPDLLVLSGDEDVLDAPSAPPPLFHVVEEMEVESGGDFEEEFVPSEEREVTEEEVERLFSEKVESLNGNYEALSDSFREWHETLRVQTGGGEELLILPYTVIDFS